MSADLKFHPLAGIFPLMEGAEFDALVADIKANGLHYPVILYDGKILDGRNRYRACLAAGFEPTVRNGDNWIGDPASFVISRNIHRRHLTTEQKRDLIAKLLKRDPSKSDRQIAETVKASPTFVGKLRAKGETTGDVSTVDTRIDKRGRKLPAKKPKARNNGENADDPETSAETMKAEFAASDGKAAAPSEAEPDDPDPQPVAYPEIIRENALNTISRHKAVAEAYRKIFKLARSRLEDTARAEIDAAIRRLIRKWKVVLNTLEYEVPTGGGHE
jgi:hypothetical protein